MKALGGRQSQQTPKIKTHKSANGSPLAFCMALSGFQKLNAIHVVRGPTRQTQVKSIYLIIQFQLSTIKMSHFADKLSYIQLTLASLASLP